MSLREPHDLSQALGIDFSDEQLAAATAALEPGVIIAGAGSGKTTVMAARVVWLVGTGQVRPDQVLGLTFTRKAAGELAERIRTALRRGGVLLEGADEQGEEVVMTYDSFAGRLVSEHGLRIGEESDRTLITGAARYRLASRVVRRAPGPVSHLSRVRPATLTERVLSLDAMMQAHRVSPERIRNHAARFARELDQAPLSTRGAVYRSVTSARATVDERVELLGLVADYQRLKDELGVAEFADQMAVAAAVVEQVPAVRELTRDTFKVVLLDEYQDTSSAQAELLRGLFSGPSAGEGAGHPVTAVGDPFQAIYGWRGAAASNILRFHRDFPRVGPAGQLLDARRHQLSVNRRSGQQVLDVANRVATSLRTDPVLTVHDPAGEGTPIPLVAPEDTPAATVRAASFISWPDEVEWLADLVVDRHRSGTIALWSDAAVLLRRNADLGAVHSALRERDVPVEIVGLGGLLSLPEVADVLATLRLVNDVTSNPDLVRLLTGPRWRIGPRDLAVLGRRARELAGRRLPVEGRVADLADELDGALAETDESDVLSLLEAVDDPGTAPLSDQARQRLAIFSGELEQLRRHSGEPVLDQVRRVITTLGLEVELQASTEAVAARRADHLGVFVDAVASYVDVDGDTSLAGLLAWLQAEIDHGVGLEQATPSDRDSVKLLTVHRAKGLEWDLVVVPALVDDVFPSDRVTENWVRAAHTVPAELRGDADSIAQLGPPSDKRFTAYNEEQREANRLSEDRLAYVAFTRARRELVATTHRWRPGLSSAREPSPYWQVVAEEAARQGRLHPVVDDTAERPSGDGASVTPWPVPVDSEGRRRRLEAAELVRAAKTAMGHQGPLDEELSLDETLQVAEWDQRLEHLLLDVERRRSASAAVELPESLSVTAMVTLHRAPHSYAAQLVRPLPRPVNPAATLGSRFHEWVEQHHGPTHLVDPLVDIEDDVVTDDDQLAALVAAFRAGEWASKVPAAVEVPFVMALGNHVVRGKIDAVYPSEDGTHRWLLVDWKTSDRPADPVQLAIYRLAWAASQGVDVDLVDACYVHVASGRRERPERWMGRAELVDLLSPRREPH
ncbi:ATP-dependent DNA helicase [Aestuariimicrobium ganziense]|uniref:ATP-dependent DNA helicase n=1 Tax=Aestuariimicrobium ganziense TaxID=2773677 RepID=UPI001941B787|nr:ATP-dependent DNA helicase [Aestuariimicrobium ganziense]